MARKGGDTLEITEGITENANRVALKGVFSNFGDVLACWVPPVDRRGVDAASVRFSNPAAAEAALQACEAGHVFFQGLQLKCRYRTGGGPRVGNSDVGGTVGGRSPDRGARKYITRDKSRSRGRRRDRSRERRRAKTPSKSRSKSAEPDPMASAMLMNNAFNMDTTGMSPSMMGAIQHFAGGMQGGMPLPPHQMNSYGGASMYPGVVPGQQPLGSDLSALMGMDAQMAGSMQALQAQLDAHMPPTEAPALAIKSPEELKKEAEELQARKERQAKRSEEMKKNNIGVAALVQNALKRTQEHKRAAEEAAAKDPANKAAEERNQQKIAEQAKKDAEREQIENERKKAKEEAAARAQRIRMGVMSEKKKEEEKAVDLDNLYNDMPLPDQNPAPQSEAKLKELRPSIQATTFGSGINQDRSKVIFLDVDGVLRPAKAGGFEAVSIGGAHAVKADTSDFFAGAMQALRYIVERTGALIVLSSEWRRDENLTQAVNGMLNKHGMRNAHDATTVLLDRELGTNDVIKSFCERRAREITDWLQRHEHEVREWVVIDDVNLSMADESKKASTKAMGPRLVQTVPLFGLTMGNAKTAVRILLGEMIQKVVVKKSLPAKPTEQVNDSGTATPMPGRGGGGFATPMPGMRRR